MDTQQSQPDEIIIPEGGDYRYEAVAPAASMARPQRSSGLLGLVERLPGVHSREAASRLLLATALVAAILTVIGLRNLAAAPSSVPVQDQKDYRYGNGPEGTAGSQPTDTQSDHNESDQEDTTLTPEQ